MVCRGIDPAIDIGIEGILAFPTTCYYWYWGVVMAAIFVILSFILFNRDKDKFQRSDMISSMGVAALATIFLTLILSLLNVVQTDVFITIFVGGMVFVVLWLLKK